MLADCEAGLLRVVELKDIQIPRDLVLIYRKDKALTRAAQAFIEIVQSREPPAVKAAGPQKPR